MASETGTMVYKLLTSSDTVCAFASSVSYFCLAIRLEVSIIAPGTFSKSGVEKVFKLL